MQIRFTKTSEKQLQKLNKNLAKRIYGKIKLLADNPRLAKSEKLGGNKGYRIRIGDYRVVYTLEKDFIKIVRVKHRRDVYRF